MIVKFILLILFVWLGLRIYQTLQINKQKKVTSQKSHDMVSCDTCGIHLPVDEAIRSGEKHFCSRDHLPKKD